MKLSSLLVGSYVPEWIILFVLFILSLPFFLQLLRSWLSVGNCNEIEMILSVVSFTVNLIVSDTQQARHWVTLTLHLNTTSGLSSSTW